MSGIHNTIGMMIDPYISSRSKALKSGLSISLSVHSG